MILSDGDIRKALAAKQLVIEPPPPPGNFDPTALDLRVSDVFKRWKKMPEGASLAIDLSKLRIPAYDEYVEDIQPDQDGLITVPKDHFILTQTREVIDLPLPSKLAARVEGRSSLARVGLAVHITAPIIHAGFSGPIVLELKNLGPHTLRIRPMETCICQIVFEQVSSEPTAGLDSDFQNQTDPMGRR